MQNFLIILYILSHFLQVEVDNSFKVFLLFASLYKTKKANTIKLKTKTKGQSILCFENIKNINIGSIITNKIWVTLIHFAILFTKSFNINLSLPILTTSSFFSFIISLHSFNFSYFVQLNP